MKHLFFLTLLLSIGITSLAQKKEQKAVRACFDNYKSAILDDKGSEAVEYLSQITVNYYSDMLEKSIKADSSTVDGLDLMDKLMVFSLRHRTPADALLSFNGKSVIVYAIQEGMIGKASVAGNELGKITINDQSAKGQFITRGSKTEMFFQFYKENENWKLDITTVFSMANKVFKQLIKDDGRPENEYFFYLLEMISGEKVSDSIWQPIAD